jgi:sirohydrochlorin ferrochelatase
MSGSNGTHRPAFRVVTLESARQQLLNITQQVADAGAGSEVATAIRQIYTRLKSDPHDFGEPLNHLPAMKLTVRRAAIVPVFVEYGVHDEKSIVFVRRILWLNSPSA